MQIHELGDDVDYFEAWALQRAAHERVVDGGAPELFLLEHASVYTAGTRTEPSDLPKNGAPVVEVDRGGRITWHGPGQLVAYPIVQLPDPVRVVDWVRRLEESMLRTLAVFDIAAARIPGRAGVWMPRDATRVDRKIGQVGVRVAARTSMHGIALNVAPDLAAFDAIVPCGIADAGVTSIARERASAPSVIEVGRTFAAQLGPLLDFEPFETVEHTMVDAS